MRMTMRGMGRDSCTGAIVTQRGVIRRDAQHEYETTGVVTQASDGSGHMWTGAGQFDGVLAAGSD